MPSNRLSVLFDKKLKHSKSASILTDQYSGSSTQYQVQQHGGLYSKRQSHVPDTIMHEYTFGRTGSQAPPSKTSSWPQSRPSQPRARTTPFIDPPDELFLKTIRRRSAAARLEEMRIEVQQKSDPEMAMRVAFASALPPSYLDSPPEYQSPTTEQQQYLPYRRPDPVAPLHLRTDASGIDKHLNLQIDETIAQFSSIKVTGPTPIAASQDLSMIVSPLNDIDQIYLERRRLRKRQERH